MVVATAPLLQLNVHQLGHPLVDYVCNLSQSLLSLLAFFGHLHGLNQDEHRLQVVEFQQAKHVQVEREFLQKGEVAMTDGRGGSDQEVVLVVVVLVAFVGVVVGDNSADSILIVQVFFSLILFLVIAVGDGVSDSSVGKRHCLCRGLVGRVVFPRRLILIIIQDVPPHPAVVGRGAVPVLTSLLRPGLIIVHGLIVRRLVVVVVLVAVVVVVHLLLTQRREGPDPVVARTAEGPSQTTELEKKAVITRGVLY